MYIPNQQTIELSWPLTRDESPEPVSFTFASRAAVSSTNSTTNVDDLNPPNYNGTATAFIAVSITVLIFLALIISYVVYRKIRSGEDDSDNESSTSDSAWRVEAEYGSPSSSIAAKHRKRIKKLEQVAPSQTLRHWRSDKEEHHVKTFATISTKLICAICLDVIQDSDTIRELQCCHVYHTNCLNLWVERAHHDCPLCKYDILGAHQDPQKVRAAGQAVPEGGDSHSEHLEGPREHPAVTASRELQTRIQQANVPSPARPTATAEVAAEPPTADNNDTEETQPSVHGANAEESSGRQLP
ncbi:hypothetical protein PV08_00580 [Exophiala spinifera]|uniref:RING-type domain-containing protein n=1 Tax=Exophiala spinifera TaxID=91928 RepID=A0A0D2BNA9_9EURO|nr:uncharacterized protein PV08_00580 [Exophiala spinifera]KIW20005.1 hypothetical protein PV08_00580 [Exophiala spinifera]